MKLPIAAQVEDGPGRMSAGAHDFGMPLFRSSTPAIAVREADLGTDSVTSRPGRCSISLSLPRLPRCGPSGTRPLRMAQYVVEPTAQMSASAAALRSAQAYPWVVYGSSSRPHAPTEERNKRGTRSSARMAAIVVSGGAPHLPGAVLPDLYPQCRRRAMPRVNISLPAGPQGTSSPIRHESADTAQRANMSAN